MAKHITNFTAADFTGEKKAADKPVAAPKPVVEEAPASVVVEETVEEVVLEESAPVEE